MSRFYKLDIRGKNWLQRVNPVPVWTAADEGRMVYDESDEQVKFGNSSEWSNAGQYNDVPLNTILLIDSNTQLPGYTLLTNKDDIVVYVTKGSGAGGQAGGTDYTAGTWTQPNHTHSQPTHVHNVGSHVHSIASHTHTTTAVALSVAQLAPHTHPPQAGFTNFMSSSGSGLGESGDSYGVFANTGSSGSGSTHSHGATGAGSGNTGAPSGSTNTASGGGDVTGNDATANTWRPKGRNFTRQQRT